MTLFALHFSAACSNKDLVCPYGATWAFDAATSRTRTKSCSAVNLECRPLFPLRSSSFVEDVTDDVSSTTKAMEDASEFLDAGLVEFGVTVAMLMWDVVEGDY